jgi:hypothetical protein
MVDEKAVKVRRCMNDAVVMYAESVHKATSRVDFQFSEPAYSRRHLPLRNGLYFNVTRQLSTIRQFKLIIGEDSWGPSLLRSLDGLKI